MDSLDRQIVIVTGVGSGIGHGIALMAARERAAVMVAELNGDGDAATTEKKTTAFTPDRWWRVIDVNLSNAFHCSRACLPTLRKEGGAIVNFASVHAQFGFPGAAAYDASKGGMVALTRSLAVKNGKHNVRVNAICPGYIDTPLWEEDLANHPNPDEFDRLTRENHPLGRRGTPADVARAARFPLSDESNWITGTTLVVDGGMSAKYFERGFDGSIRNIRWRLCARCADVYQIRNKKFE